MLDYPSNNYILLQCKAGEVFFLISEYYFLFAFIIATRNLVYYIIFFSFLYRLRI